MSITDELREYVGLGEGTVPCEIRAIADRIDEQHAVKVERLEKYRASVDAMLKEYVKLPVDADGVPIHVGDTVEEVGEDPTRYTVCGVGTLQERPAVFYGNPSEYGYADGWDFAENVCHVQPDTWERIIEDAANLVRGDNESVVELVERCRRLAGEE